MFLIKVNHIYLVFVLLTDFLMVQVRADRRHEIHRQKK